MNKILKRDEYVIEVYNPMIEQKEYDELVAINEGLLKNLFGKLSNMFKKDWGTIKGDKNIIAAYKEMDDKLTGFATMKKQKREDCNRIRQALVDFACDWYDLKMSNAKEANGEPKPAKSMKFKNETLKSNLEACEKKIKDIAGEDSLMLKWANLLLDDMKIVINKSILSDINDEEQKKELQKQMEEDLKNPEKVNKMLQEWERTQLEEVKKERNELISDTQSTPISEDILGDKAIQNLVGEYDKKYSAKNKQTTADYIVDRITTFNKEDSTFGLKSIYKNETDPKNKDIFPKSSGGSSLKDLFKKNPMSNEAKAKFETAFSLMDSFYSALKSNDVAKKFGETPGVSVQAMCIAINSFIKNCVFGGDDYGNELPLMAKCAILSNGLISYDLPLNDIALDKGLDAKGAGNYFTDIVDIITNGELKYADGENKGKPIELNDDFKTNAKALFTKIKDEATKLKDASDKKYEEEQKKLNLDKKEK